MKQTTQCYLECGSQYLMLHRTKKVNDENHDKWISQHTIMYLGFSLQKYTLFSILRILRNVFYVIF